MSRGHPVIGICAAVEEASWGAWQVVCHLAPCSYSQAVQRAGGVALLPLGHDAHRHTPGAFSDHSVRLERGSLAARAVGTHSTGAKSHHHQGVDKLGERVVATGWSDGDGVVEAIEIPERRFALGVLWHPEEDLRSRVIAALVEEARRSP